MGDFNGVKDTIYYWVDYIEQFGDRKPQRVTVLNCIGNRQTQFLISSSDQKTGSVRGYVFVLDKDNNNTGTGYITITLNKTDLVEPILIDAAM